MSPGFQASAAIRRCSSLVERLRELGGDESGATAIEYGLVIGGIAVVIIAAVYAFGAKVNNLYNLVSRWQ